GGEPSQHHEEPAPIEADLGELGARSDRPGPPTGACHAVKSGGATRARQRFRCAAKIVAGAFSAPLRPAAPRNGSGMGVPAGRPTTFAAQVKCLAGAAQRASSGARPLCPPATGALRSPPMREPTRFATDDSLDHLARRLRFLGFDVVTHKGARLEELFAAAGAA